MPKVKSGPRGKPRGIRRDRDCQSCKDRNVKCDLNRPRCLPCVQSGLACGGYPQRVVWAGEASNRRSSVDTVVPSPTTRPELLHQDKDKDKATDQYNLVQRLLAFCRNVRASDLSPPSTLSVDQALSLISRVDDFLQARIKPPSPAPSPQSSSDSDTFELHRLAALASLSEALKTADPVAFLGITVFAFFEVVSDGAFGEWQCHLRGARSLLDYHCRSRSELDQLSNRVTGLAEMVSYFGWWDIIGTIVRQCGRRDEAQDGLIFDDWHRSILGDDFFNTVGCPADTFWLFVSLAKGQDMDTQGAMIRAIDQLLHLGTDTTDRGACFDAYRCAAAISVLSLHPQPGTEASLKTAIDRICDSVEHASPTSRFYIHMATPAFMAATHATEIHHCDVLRTYWRNCQTGELPRYSGARAQCEEMWRMKGLI